MPRSRRTSSARQGRAESPGLQPLVTADRSGRSERRCRQLRSLWRVPSACPRLRHEPEVRMSQEQTNDGIELVPLATVSVAGGDRYKIDGGPFGNRVVAGIRDGRWDGERLRGNSVGAGGDWAMPGPGGAMLL